MEWEKVINENRQELLTAIKDAYEKALMAEIMPADCYYQVEIDYDGAISTYLSNGGGSEEVRNGKAILIYLARLHRREDGDLLPEDFWYIDYMDDDNKEAVRKLMAENDLDEEEAIQIYDQSLIGEIEAKLREETIKERCDLFSAEEALEKCVSKLQMEESLLGKS